MIDVDEVTKSFGSTQALAGVSFSVAQGEIVGLLGPNGAGKTTLVRTVATLLRPDSGCVRIGGFDVARQPQRARELIGLAGQSAAVDDLLTGRENLELVGRLYGLARDDRRRRARAALERFDLVEPSDRLVRTYSGGMRRRLDLAVTLVGRPAVILLDEPTAGLDPRSRRELWELVEQVAGEGTTVLLTSQYLDEVERLAKRIVVIDRGVIIADGSADELKRAVGGDVLEARVVELNTLERAGSLLADIADAPAFFDQDDHRVAVPTSAGISALVTAARRLGDAHIPLADLGLRRPSLDDVFFALTGDGATSAPLHVPNRQGPTPDVAESAANGRHAASQPARHSAISDMTAITGRYLLRFVRIPQLVFLAVAQPVLFVVMLNAVFGGLVAPIAGGSYIQYLLPGVLVMSVMLGASVTSAGVAEDLQAGVIDRFRSLPMSRSAVLVGRTVADLVRTAASILVVFAVGVAMGYELHSITAALGGLALLLVFAFAISWLFSSVGIAVKQPEAAQLAGFLPVLPLVFVSGVWIPVSTMSGGLQAFARNQPVSVLVEALRALGDGGPAYHWAWQSVAWSVAILIISIPVCVRQYRGAGV
jgi:ABC-2 type transport system ATP-binding protein